MSRPCFLYIVKCSDGTLYTGVSVDVGRRIEQHNKGKGAKYTRSRRPVKLLYMKKYNSRSEAQKAEYHFKKLSRKEKLKRMGF